MRDIVASNNCSEGHCPEAGMWWYWVSIGQYWLVLGGTGSVEEFCQTSAILLLFRKPQ